MPNALFNYAFVLKDVTRRISEETKLLKTAYLAPTTLPQF